MIAKHVVLTELNIFKAYHSCKYFFFIIFPEIPTDTMNLTLKCILIFLWTITLSCPWVEFRQMCSGAVFCIHTSEIVYIFKSVFIWVYYNRCNDQHQQTLTNVSNMKHSTKGHAPNKPKCSQIALERTKKG